MESPLTIRPADYPEPYPHPVLDILDRVDGTVRGKKEFVARNTGAKPRTVNVDVVPRDGWPPADAFTVTESQFDLVGGETRSLMVEVAVPSPPPPRSGARSISPPIAPHSFQVRLRSPRVAHPLSVPVECWPPMPARSRLTAYPEGGNDLRYGRNDMAFYLEFILGFGEVGFRFDIGAPDDESASWFSVDEPVQATPGPDWIGQPGTMPPTSLRWAVTVDARAARASGRSSVLLEPAIRFTDPPGWIPDPYRPDEGGGILITPEPSPPSDLFARWRKFPVRIKD